MFRPSKVQRFTMLQAHSNLTRLNMPRQLNKSQRFSRIIHLSILQRSSRLQLFKLLLRQI